MFPITITIHDQAQLTLVAAALSGHTKGATPAPKPAAVPAAASGPATAPAAEAAAPTTTESAPTPAAASAAAKPQASTAATEPVTYAQVKPLILKINTAKGRDAATAALAKFGVTKGPELKPEQFADFIVHANEVLAAEGVAA